MSDVIVVGDGPGGLSAALFLAKNDLDVVVFAQDKTPMHKAKLFNYLGINEITGPEFQRLAREQVQGFGARIVDSEVTGGERTGEGFSVAAADGSRTEARYLIIATGAKVPLVEALAPEMDGDEVRADRDGRTSVDRLYAVGWSARRDKIQAIISAGEGAAAALDILSTEAGEDVHDFDLVDGD
jgi:thioredoxin reductase